MLHKRPIAFIFIEIVSNIKRYNTRIIPSFVGTIEFTYPMTCEKLLVKINFERIFKVHLIEVSIFGISFIVLEVLTSLYYANYQLDDIIRLTQLKRSNTDSTAT